MPDVALRAGGAALAVAQARWSGRSVVLTLGLALLLAWLALSLGEGARLAGAAAQGLWARPDLVALFALTYTVAFALRAVAWRRLLPSGPGVPRLFVLLQIALLANHVFPTKVGELARVGLLARHGVPVGAAAASTALARLLDFAALCLIALVLAPLAGGRVETLLPLMALPLAGVVLGAALALLLATGRLAALEPRLPRRATAALRAVQAALAATSPPQLLGALALTIPSWLLEAGALWATAQAAGVPLALSVAAAVTAFTIAFQAFQVAPGGLGTYEASQTAALALYGIEPATGLALALATHALKFAYAYVVGAACLATALGVPRLWATARAVALARRLAQRRPAWLDADLGLAGLALLVAALLGTTALPTGLPLLAALVAVAPLVVLGRCHHLPPAARALLLGVPLGFGALFGLPAPGAALVALGLGSLASARRRAWPPAVVLWPALLTQALVAGAAQPLAVGAFALAALCLLVLARQWWLAHRPLPAPGPAPAGGMIAVLIPVHNEAATIGAVIGSVPRQALADAGYRTVVIVVDDGSTDGSGRVAQAAGAERVIRHPARRGLGAALRTGLAAARASNAAAAAYLDGDGEYQPADLPAVLQPVLQGEADYVLGARFPAAARVMSRSRLWGNRLLTALMCLLTGRRLADAQTGFRAFSARALACAEIAHDYNYAQVLTLDLLRKRLRLAQVPIGYARRQHGRSFIRYPEYLRRVLPAMAAELLRP
jgi:uncharacterized membrane protein YbhN (UPF0104 family)